MAQYIPLTKNILNQAFIAISKKIAPFYGNEKCQIYWVRVCVCVSVCIKSYTF